MRGGRGEIAEVQIFGLDGIEKKGRQEGGLELYHFGIFSVDNAWFAAFGGRVVLLFGESLSICSYNNCGNKRC